MSSPVGNAKNNMAFRPSLYVSRGQRGRNSSLSHFAHTNTHDGIRISSSSFEKWKEGRVEGRTLRAPLSESDGAEGPLTLKVQRVMFEMRGRL